MSTGKYKYLMECRAEHLVVEPWPFPVPINAGVFTVQTASKGAPITYVSRGEDSWEALPNGGPFDPQRDACFVCLGCLIRQNPGLLAVADLAMGESATLVKGRWIRRAS